MADVLLGNYLFVRSKINLSDNNIIFSINCYILLERILLNNHEVLPLSYCHLLALVYCHVYWLCACYLNFISIDSLPSISSVKFKDHLSMAVGTATGQVCFPFFYFFYLCMYGYLNLVPYSYYHSSSRLCRSQFMFGMFTYCALLYMYWLKFYVVTVVAQILLYDLRSNRPSLVKDHNYGLPIKDIEFQNSQSLVLSCDSRILKLWDEHTVSINISCVLSVFQLSFSFWHCWLGDRKGLWPVKILLLQQPQTKSRLSKEKQQPSFLHQQMCISC